MSISAGGNVDSTGADASVQRENIDDTQGSNTLQNSEDQSGSETVGNRAEMGANVKIEGGDVPTSLGNVDEDDLDTDPYGMSADDDGIGCEGDGNEENESEFQTGDFDEEEDYENENEHDVADSEENYRTLYIETRAYLISVLKKKFKILLSIGADTQALYKNETLTVPQLELLRERYCAMLGDKILDDSASTVKGIPGPSTPHTAAHAGKSDMRSPPKKILMSVGKVNIMSQEQSQVSIPLYPHSQSITPYPSD